MKNTGHGNSIKIKNEIIKTLQIKFTNWVEKRMGTDTDISLEMD